MARMLPTNRLQKLMTRRTLTSRLNSNPLLRKSRKLKPRRHNLSSTRQMMSTRRPQSTTMNSLLLISHRLINKLRVKMRAKRKRQNLRRSLNLN